MFITTRLIDVVSFHLLCRRIWYSVRCGTGANSYPTKTWCCSTIRSTRSRPKMPYTVASRWHICRRTRSHCPGCTTIRVCHWTWPVPINWRLIRQRMDAEMRYKPSGWIVVIQSVLSMCKFMNANFLLCRIAIWRRSMRFVIWISGRNAISVGCPCWKSKMAAIHRLICSIVGY